MVKITEKLKRHIIDTTGILAVINPLKAGIETFMVGMTNGVSLNTRLLVSVFGYAGLGTLFSKGRDLSRKTFHITNETKEKVQSVHDSLYSMVFNLALTPPIYFLAGARDIEEVAIATGISVATASITGYPIGWGIDSMRDFTGIQDSERLPKKLRNQSPAVKKGLAALLIGSSIATMGLIYSLNSNKEELNYFQQEVQEVQEVLYENLQGLIKKSDN